MPTKIHHTPFSFTTLKVAIIHDWLVTYAGAERVLEQLIEAFPQADLFSLIDFIPTQKRQFLHNKPVQTSFIQKLPFAQKHYQKYLPLMPIAIEQFDLSGYDLVISSSHAVAKGVITGVDQMHICYTYTPMRYLWEMQYDYLKWTKKDRGLKSWVIRYFLHRLRIWDVVAALRVDHYIACSHFIRNRIQKTYRQPAYVIYPPVDIPPWQMHKKQNYYVTASRLVPYKNVKLIAQAFLNMPDKKLIIIGDGEAYQTLQKMTQQAQNIQMVGHLPHAELQRKLGEAKAFVFAAYEDFGIAPVEAQALGTPVIAYGKGGALETIKSGETGLFFYQQTPQAIQAAIQQFETQKWNPQKIRQQAEQFSVQQFQTQIKRYIARLYQEGLQNKKWNTGDENTD